jgi:uncharacterized membrane protein YfhO/putative flippase GtrA
MLDKIKEWLARLPGGAALAEKFNYLFFGVLTTIVNFAVFGVADRLLGIDYRPATVAAWVVAVAFAYVTNKIFVFKSKAAGARALSREVLTFLAARVVSLLFDVGWMILAVEVLHMNTLLAKILSNVVVVVMNYVFSKKVVFRQGGETETDKGGARRWLMPALAFSLPMLMLLVVYIIHNIAPFGDQTILIVDNYHQYTPFMMEFGDMLREGDSLLHSWNAGLGSNFLVRYAYYLSSPLSFLSVFVKESLTVTFLLGLITLRAGFASLFMYFYLRGKARRPGAGILAFSVMYALCAFFLAYYWNVMWFEAVALFPLVALGLERLVDKKGGALYCIALALTILSNFFMAIMVCIYTVLYFFVYCLSKEPGDGYAENGWWRWMLRACGRFALYSGLAGGLTGILTIPAYYGLLSSSAAGASFAKSFAIYSDMLEILSKHLVLAGPTVRQGLPNLYCGVIVLVLVPLYFFNRNIRLREKIGHGLLMLFMWLSFNINLLDFVWHGMHFPNSLPFRFSFLYVFLVLGLSYRAFTNLDGVRPREVAGAFAAAAGLLFIMEMNLPESVQKRAVYITLIAILAYALILALLRYLDNAGRGRLHAWGAALLCVLICGEVLVNAVSGFDAAGLVSSDNYVASRDQVTPAVEKMKSMEQGFERMEFTDREAYNMPVVYDYKGISHYSSTSYINVNRLMGKLGLFQTTAWYVYESAPPPLNAIFSLKYLLNRDGNFDNGQYPLVEQVGDVRVYENPYWLPVGFMVADSIFEWDLKTPDPFLAQENFLTAALGVHTPVFRRIDPQPGQMNGVMLGEEKDGVYQYTDQGGAGSLSASFSVTAPSDGPVYVYARSPRTKAVAVQYGERSRYHESKYAAIMDAGNMAGGEQAQVTLSLDQGDSTISLYAVGFDWQAWAAAYERLAAQGLEVTSYTDTGLTGVVNAETPGVLFTSIPYDSAWQATVDGVPTYVQAVGDGALCALPLEAGRHEIVFRYRTVGLGTGIFVTLVSAVVLVLLCRADKRRKA